VMGSAIAAHLANAGFSEVTLLDILPAALTAEQAAAGYRLDQPEVRNLVARRNLNALIAAKPPQFGSPRAPQRIAVGNLEDHFEAFVGRADWIIEVVPELAAVKNATFIKIDRYRKAGAWVSSNTSGIPISEMVAGCSPRLQEHFLVTHFFNPVRFMRLFEVVRGPQTLPEVFDGACALAEERLGKVVVESYDVPAFVGNRIGLFHIMFLMSLVGRHEIEVINDVFDRSLGYGGKPFSTGDLVGLDTLAHVVRHLQEHTHDERHALFTVPPFLERLVKEGRLGRKSGAGFFKREKIGGRNLDFVLDPVTGGYVPRKPRRFGSLELAKRAKGIEEAMRTLYGGGDEAAAIFRESMHATIGYAFARAPEVSPKGIEGIDLALRWGFNQKKGPGEILDILGVDRVVAALEKTGPVPPLLAALVKAGRGRVYTGGKAPEVFQGDSGYRPVTRHARTLHFADLAKESAPVETWPRTGRLFALPDGLFAFEMQTKNGVVNLALIQAIHRALDLAEAKGRALVIGNDLENFSFGADLDMLAGYILRGKAEVVHRVVESFQLLNHRLKFAKIPVVVAKRGMALGGGCELGYGAHQRVAFDSYIGLVEVGVGLIPGGGGVKETLIRSWRAAESRGEVKPLEWIKGAFEQLAFAKVSASGEEGRDLSYLSPDDGITMNTDFLLGDALDDARRLAADYRPPQPCLVPLPGRDALATLSMGIDLGVAARQVPPMKVPAFIRRHFARVLKELAGVCCGGDLPSPGARFTELEILALERKAFLRLTARQGLASRVAWLLIASSTLKKSPIPWALASIRNSLLRPLA